MSKTYNETRVRLRWDDKEQVLSESAATKVIAEAESSGKPGPEVIASQTFTFVEATSLSEISELIASEVEALNIFNRGYVLKQQSIAREIIMDNDFSPTEGSYELLADAAELRERRKATPAEKAARQLGKLSTDDLAKVLEQFGIKV